MVKIIYVLGRVLSAVSITSGNHVSVRLRLEKIDEIFKIIHERRTGSQSYISKNHSCYCVYFPAHTVTASVMGMVITTGGHNVIWGSIENERIDERQNIENCIINDVGDWKWWYHLTNETGRGKRLLQCTSREAQAKMWRAVDLKAGLFQNILFLDRWWVSSGSFVPFLFWSYGYGCHYFLL